VVCFSGFSGFSGVTGCSASAAGFGTAVSFASVVGAAVCWAYETVASVDPIVNQLIKPIAAIQPNTRTFMTNTTPMAETIYRHPVLKTSRRDHAGKRRHGPGLQRRERHEFAFADRTIRA